jgi:hypothetical protein
VAYDRRRPELTALHQAVAEGWPQLRESSERQSALACRGEGGAGLGLGPRVTQRRPARFVGSDRADIEHS